VSGQLAGYMRVIADIIWKIMYTIEDSKEFFASLLRVDLEFYPKNGTSKSL
jgi:hypothetical protein